MLSRIWFMTILVVVFLPVLAVAQDATPLVEPDPPWLGLLTVVLGAISGSSLLSALVKSNNIIMKVIDIIALNFLRARNDPAVN
jgi:hypothetical protein